MELSRVRAHAMSSPIDPMQERPFHGGIRRLHKRDVVVVVLQTEDGLQGVAPAGASSSAMREYFEGASQAAFADAIRTEVAPVLEGQDIEDGHQLRTAMAKVDLPDRLREEATAALDVALYDLQGRRHGAGIADLLAEEHDTGVEEEMALYASAGMYMEPAGYVRQAEILERNGFVGYKYRPGIGPRNDRRILEALAATLEHCAYMPDAHTWWKVPGDAYDRGTVKDLVAHAGEHGATWVEEPVPPSDHDAYENVADAGAALAGGESEASPEGLIALAETGAIRFLQGDVRHHGGYTGCWTAADATAELPVQFVPHHFGSWLGLVANAHLVAAMPGADLLEYPIFEADPLIQGEDDPGMYPFELAFDIVEGTPELDDGVLTLPSGDGLGIEFDDRVVDAYPFEEGPWTEFETNNP